MFEQDVLISQLSQMGRLLDEAVDKLGELDMLATGAGCEYQRLREEYEDRFAECFLNLNGGVEARKMEARLKSKPGRLIAEDAHLSWEVAKSKVRSQQEAIRAIHKRVDVGRSLLSAEKTRIELDKVT